ncbi:MAG: translation elongation factor Ts, partial [Pseudomonadota bacterium]
MAISMELIKELRQRTAAGITDCKKALEAEDGDLEKAAEYLVRKGIAKMKEKGKEALEGVIHSYVHQGGKIGVLAEINCNTDFVARTKEFQQFAEDVGMQIAAMSPLYVGSDNVPGEDLEKQRDIFMEQARELKKPEKILAQIAEGKIKKWYSEVCLLDQPFVKDDKKTIETLRGELIAKTG